MLCKRLPVEAAFVFILKSSFSNTACAGFIFGDANLLLEEYDDEDLSSFVEKFTVSWKRTHKIIEVGLS